MKAEPWLESPGIFDQDKKAFDGNPAIPYLLIKHNDILGRESHGPHLAKVQLYSSVTFLLSGGFQPYSLLPKMFYRPLRVAEQFTNSIIAPLVALRALLIWEKNI